MSDTSNTYTGPQRQGHVGVAKEFGSWPVTDTSAEAISEVKQGFDQLLKTVSEKIPSYNARYRALVATKLEEACMFATKGISLPEA
jgi:hypothetical protein